ncbi:MAG: hypothetical protein ACREBW_06165 [Candidatus Micrarchaeaceae archaeon]
MSESFRSKISGEVQRRAQEAKAYFVGKIIMEYPTFADDLQRGGTPSVPARTHRLPMFPSETPVQPISEQEATGSTRFEESLVQKMHDYANQDGLPTQFVL